MFLVKYNFVIYIWGNVLGIIKDRKYMVIKFSGVDYVIFKFEDMVIIDMDNNVYDLKYKLLSDILMYILFYKNYFEI